MTQLKELQKREQEIQTQMSELLVNVRVSNNIENPFIVARELEMSPATLRNIEKGISFPTSRTLKQLTSFYMMTPNERVTVDRLKHEMLKVRKQIKENKK